MVRKVLEEKEEREKKSLGWEKAEIPIKFERNKSQVTFPTANLCN